ncbi:unnamed protein product [Ambrosiozyma monospora]|uniref:Unnamed protein product n=1 Tax=Ambrosiozyma monospora TaxID=43982 RepID=A0A9W6YZL0_AMBMO|nr:unnamed protein product [Ambrosiozyma monospora]
MKREDQSKGNLHYRTCGSNDSNISNPQPFSYNKYNESDGKNTVLLYLPSELPPNTITPPVDKPELILSQLGQQTENFLYYRDHDCVPLVDGNWEKEDDAKFVQVVCVM